MRSSIADNSFLHKFHTPNLKRARLGHEATKLLGVRLVNVALEDCEVVVHLL